MKNELSAIDFVQTTFPPKEGERLADALIAQCVIADDLTIKLEGCPPALLISAFFNGFLQRIFEQNSSKFGAAKKVKWVAEFEFQNDNIRKWVAEFEPRKLA